MQGLQRSGETFCCRRSILSAGSRLTAEGAVGCGVHSETGARSGFDAVEIVTVSTSPYYLETVLLSTCSRFRLYLRSYAFALICCRLTDRCHRIPKDHLGLSQSKDQIDVAVALGPILYIPISTGDNSKDGGA